jgi:hypothetical protein
METALDKRELRVAVRARTNGGYTYQIFTIESEPKTLLRAARGCSYASPAEAAQAGFEAIADACLPRGEPHDGSLWSSLHRAAVTKWFPTPPNSRCD